MSGEFFAGGLHLEFFAEQGFESLKSLSGKEKSLANARNLLRLLMLEQVNGWSNAVNLKTLSFAFYEATEIDRESMLEALQEGLVHIGKQLKNIKLDEQQRRQADILIASILSYVPFSYPAKDTEIKIPHLLGNRWQMVSYQIAPIELTDNPSIPFIYTDNDRVWAYGLTPPKDNKQVNPWLLFQGTTYPSGAGFTTGVMTDMRPFRTVGHDLFVSGKPKIEKFVNQHENKVNVTGTSLGGSLSLLTACCLGDKCRQIVALNPAGLVENSALAKIDKWETFKENKPEVMVIKQGADPVSIFGTWKEDWLILCAKVIKHKQCPNFFTHHFVNFAGSCHTRFVKEPKDYDKTIRSINNVIWYTGGRAVIYALLLLPWRYVLIPLYRLAKAALFASYALTITLVGSAVSLLSKLAMAIMNGISTLVASIGSLASNICSCFNTKPDLDMQRADIENQNGNDHQLEMN